MPDLSSFAQKAFLACNLGLGLVFFLIDEPLHCKRGLNRWEKISHPVDALCSAITFAIGYFACIYKTSLLFWSFCLTALITIIMSFKDEFVHKEHCSAQENLVHAAMFSLNAAALCFGSVVVLVEGSAWVFLVSGAFALLAMLWQISFWFFWRKTA